MSIPFRGSNEDFAKFKAEHEAKYFRPVLTPGQQLALLIIRRSDLSREIVAKLAHSTVRASEEDYRELMQRGFVMREGDKRIVTFVGKIRADAVAKALAKELDIHFFLQGGSRYQSHVACTCGWNYSHSRNEGHERSAFARRMGEHLTEIGQASASVVAGSSPAPDPAEEYREAPFQ